VIGPITMEQMIRCWRKDDFQILRYRRRFDSCGCLAHEFARSWFKVTGDTDIVHGTPVLSGEGAATYMGKYLTKSFAWDEEYRSLCGMERRWSSSVGWPGSGRIRLKYTTQGLWHRSDFRPGPVEDTQLGGPDELLERDGEDFVKLAFEKGQVKKLVKSMRRNFRD